MEYEEIKKKFMAISCITHRFLLDNRSLCGYLMIITQEHLYQMN